MSSKNKRVLVTGVAGFLGSHLSEKLTQLGHSVVGIDNMGGGYKDNIPKNIVFQRKLYQKRNLDLSSDQRVL